MEQTKQYEYVDLGLPSGLKWAKCNVGAEKETDYGYYFQWGEIEDHGNAAYRCTHYKSSLCASNIYNACVLYFDLYNVGVVENRNRVDGLVVRGVMD